MRTGLCFFFALVLVSCHTSITRTNDKDDMNKGIAYAANFYGEVHAGDLDVAASHISKSIASREEALKLLQTIEEMRGNLDSVQTVRTGSTYTVSEGDTIEKYSLELKAFYSKGITKETMNIEREGNVIKLRIQRFSDRRC